MEPPARAAFLFEENFQNLASMNELFRSESEWTHIACEMASLTAGSFFTLHDKNDLGGHSGQ